uniref:NAD(P)(+)--arginine ADP-ribosyltransferase n=1 Tax=Anas platyrhynchos TaxID=8839 RepID=A0A8B9SHH6_ANAPL
MEHLGLGWVLLAGTLAVALKKLYHVEFKNHIYADTWRRADERWRKQWGNSNHPQVLRREYAVAVLEYTANTGLYSQFNTAVREGGRSRGYYLQSFPFKTLHFLLTEALHTLRNAQGHRCYNVYRGVKGIHFTAHRHQTVRFGHFASASLQKNDTLFFVYTCYGVPIWNFSFYPNEKEVLIPPYEVFKVTDVTHYPNGTHIHLRSHGARTTYNCALVNGKGRQQGGYHQEMGTALGRRRRAPRAPASVCASELSASSCSQIQVSLLSPALLGRRGASGCAVLSCL